MSVSSRSLQVDSSFVRTASPVPSSARSARPLSTLASGSDELDWKRSRVTSYSSASPLSARARVDSSINVTGGISSCLIEELYYSSKKPRTFAQWEEAATLHLRDLKQYGSSTPFVWVLVKGKDIPSNAIVAGEQRRQPLYIARTFYEGGLCVGKAGRQLEKGASISYNGFEVQVDTYEVLVAALQPVRYKYCEYVRETVSVPTVQTPQITRVTGYDRLSLIKTVVLIDDSASMAGALWREARDVLGQIVDLYAKYSRDGLDFFFMNDGLSGNELKDGSQVRQMFDSMQPVGETPVGTKLAQLFDRYIPLVEKNHQHQPITIVVVTDGVPTDDLEGTVVNAARRLDRANVPPRRLGVQFVQIGDDPDAAQFLKELDDDLHIANNCRDIVDAFPFQSSGQQLTTETVLKVILDAVDKVETQSGKVSTSYESRQVRSINTLQAPRSPQSIPRSPRVLELSTGRSPSIASQSSYTAQVSTRIVTERLKDIKIVTLVDDSGFMDSGFWREAREAVAGIVESNSLVSSSGIDLFFVNNLKFQTDILHANEARDIFDTVVPEGHTAAGSRLRTLFDRYLPLLADSQHRSILLLVIARGAPTDDVDGALIDASHRIEQDQILAKRFNVEFVQIGDDFEAARYARYLNEDFVSRNAGRRIVHGVPFDPAERRLTAERLVKIVSVAIDLRLETINSGQRSRVSYYETNAPRPSSVYSQSVTTRVGTERFKDVKIVTVVDDSSFMDSASWREAREAVAGIVESNNLVGSVGIDLFFINNLKFQTDILNPNEARDIFDSVTPDGHAATGSRLRTLFDRYLPLLVDHDQHRPILLLVIARGAPTDDVDGALIDAAQRIERDRILAKRFNVEFIQVGDDHGATTFARYLNDGFSSRNGCRSVMHGVPFDPIERRLTTERLIKIASVAIDQRLETGNVQVVSRTVYYE